MKKQAETDEAVPPTGNLSEPKQPLPLAEIRALTESLPPQPEDGGTFIRRMRDDARY